MLLRIYKVVLKGDEIPLLIEIMTERPEEMIWAIQNYKEVGYEAKVKGVYFADPQCFDELISEEGILYV